MSLSRKIVRETEPAADVWPAEFVTVYLHERSG
jgi:hypothetical protein